ncbi:hypothetical protein LXL04_010400 [Taraxacum kok-saghyz]
MKSSGKYWTCVLLFFSLFTIPSAAEIIRETFWSSRRHVFQFAEFNFTHTGYVSVAVSAARVSSALSKPDHSRLGFILLSDEVRTQHHPELYPTGGNCILDSKLISVLFTFENVSHYSFNKSFHVTHPGKNSLYFINCNQKSFVYMTVRAELYNIDCDGTTKNYLSAGLTPLPFLYSIFSFIYLCFIGFWIFVCFKNKRNFHKIPHLLMGASLAITFAHLTCAAMDRHYVKVTGTPHGWDVFFYIFKLIRGWLFFTVIVLIGGGWRSWKPFLDIMDKWALIDVIVFEVLGTLSSILVGEIGYYWDYWMNWTVDVVLADYASCIIIFFPMDWSFKSLRNDSKTDGNAPTNLEKLCLFFKVAIGYVFLTRIVVDGIVKKPALLCLL